MMYGLDLKKKIPNIYLVLTTRKGEKNGVRVRKKGKQKVKQNIGVFGGNRDDSGQHPGRKVDASQKRACQFGRVFVADWIFDLAACTF